jgi:hypothetical protein
MILLISWLIFGMVLVALMGSIAGLLVSLALHLLVLGIMALGALVIRRLFFPRNPED